MTGVAFGGFDHEERSLGLGRIAKRLSIPRIPVRKFVLFSRGTLDPVPTTIDPFLGEGFCQLFQSNGVLFYRIWTFVTDALQRRYTGSIHPLNFLHEMDLRFEGLEH